jgi:hypothetical protein
MQCQTELLRSDAYVQQACLVLTSMHFRVVSFFFQPIRTSTLAHRRSLRYTVFFPMPFTMPMMVILHENGLVGQVACKCDGGYAQPGEGSLEAIVSCERACVPPCLTVQILSDDGLCWGGCWSCWKDSLPRPWIS